MKRILGKILVLCCGIVGGAMSGLLVAYLMFVDDIHEVPQHLWDDVPPSFFRPFYQIGSLIGAILGFLATIIFLIAGNRKEDWDRNWKRGKKV